MYNNFFGFKERPFQLVPNPGYLFLSKSHEEAMAHLKYAISHGDGFVQITGEVGTGKTTLCRAFLEELDKDFEVAYVFNPQLNSIELLRTINDEFGIDSKADNAKDLIDTLNTFLMQKKAENKNALLLIDEAQNLGRDVLEQLRLLSNLETTSRKLLQIILVGQPELNKILDSYDMRQLRQRITLSWYLTPLSFKETLEYIRHRINIASQKAEDKFSNWAYRKIYKFSGGIPRLINIACDRALLTAFGYNKHKVSGWIAGNSIKELNTMGDRNRSFPDTYRYAIISIALVCLVFASLLIFKMNPFSRNQGSSSHQTNSASIPNSNESTTLSSHSSAKPDEILGKLEPKPSRLNAVKAVFTLWKYPGSLNPELNNIDEKGSFFEAAATQNNFLVLPVKDEWKRIVKLNLPAVFEFFTPGNRSTVFLVLERISNGVIFFKSNELSNEIRMNYNEMKSRWTGYAYIFSKNFFNFAGAISKDAPSGAIITLKMLLRDMGYKGITLEPFYDEITRNTIMAIQEKYKILIDGIVGTETKIILFNTKTNLNIPHILSGDQSIDKPISK